MKPILPWLSAFALAFCLNSLSAQTSRDGLLDASRAARLQQQSGGVPAASYDSGGDRSYQGTSGRSSGSQGLGLGNSGAVNLRTYERSNEETALANSRGIKEAMRRAAEALPKPYGEKRDRVSTGITDGTGGADRLARMRGETSYDYRDEGSDREKRGLLESIGDKLSGAANNEENYIAKRRAGLVTDDFNPLRNLGIVQTDSRPASDEQEGPRGLRAIPELAGNVGGAVVGTAGRLLPDSPTPSEQMVRPEHRDPEPEPVRIPQTFPAQAQPVEDASSDASSYVGGGSEDASDPRVRRLDGLFGRKTRTEAPAQTASTEPGIFEETPQPSPGRAPGNPYDTAGIEAEEEGHGIAAQSADDALGGLRKFQLKLPSISLGGNREANESADPAPAAADEGGGVGSRLADSLRGIGAASPKPTSAVDAVAGGDGDGDYYVVKSDACEFHPYDNNSVSAANSQALGAGAVIQVTKAGEEWSAVRLSNGREGIMRTKELRKARMGESKAFGGSADAVVAVPPPPARPAQPVLDPLPTQSPPKPASSGGGVSRNGNRISGSYYAAPQEVPLPNIPAGGEDGTMAPLGQGLLPPLPSAPEGD